MSHDLRAMLFRAALIAFGLTCCAWFALGARQANEIARATSIVSGAAPLAPGQAGQAASALDSAATLNPDRQVDILRAELYRDEGRLSPARATLERVIADEPQNLEAWIWLARSSKGDPAAFSLAVAQIGRLLRPVHAPR